jgi:hypothetical protein
MVLVRVPFISERYGQGTLIGGTRTSIWFLNKLGRYRNEKIFENFFLLEKRSTIRSQFV